MKLAQDPMGTAEARAMLDQLPELYFAILKNTHIEQQATGIRCSFEIPVLGKRTKTASTAKDAIRAVLVELSEVLTKTPYTEWPEDWRRLTESASSTLISNHPKANDKAERFQSKTRQFTIGVTMPSKLKLSLQKFAKQQHMSFAEVTRQLTSLGFEDFDNRIFTEGSEGLLSEFSSQVAKWQMSEAEQVMVRVDPHLAVRLRSAAKEYRRSASEFGAMCLAHGHVLRELLAKVEQKIEEVRGSPIRKLAPKVGLGEQAALLSGVLAGSIGAPRKVLRRLGEVLEVPEYALTAFFKHSFENRVMPAFKAESAKPQVFGAATPWADAVKSLNLPTDQTTYLLLLDK